MREPLNVGESFELQIEDLVVWPEDSDDERWMIVLENDRDSMTLLWENHGSARTMKYKKDADRLAAMLSSFGGVS